MPSLTIKVNLTPTAAKALPPMKKMMVERTSIVISHRVSSARLASKIIVLDDGSIVEEGTHEELLAKNGVYADLYKKQIQAEEVSSKEMN